MNTCKELEEKYNICFQEEQQEIVEDIFNNDYVLEDIEKEAFKIYVLALKELFINKNDEKFLDLIDISIIRDCLDAYFGLIIYYNNKKKYSTALEYCEVLEKEKYRLDKVYHSIASIYQTHKIASNDTIIDYYKDAIKLGFNKSNQNLGVLLATNKKYDEALEYLLNVENKSCITYFYIGLCHYFLGNYEKILDYVELSKDYGNILLGFYNLNNKCYQKAIEYFTIATNNENINNDLKTFSSKYIDFIRNSLYI